MKKDEENLIKLIKKLPEEVKPKFVAMKKISDERGELEEQFFKEMEELEKKYEQLYHPLNVQVNQI